MKFSVFQMPYVFIHHFVTYSMFVYLYQVIDCQKHTNTPYHTISWSLNTSLSKHCKYKSGNDFFAMIHQTMTATPKSTSSWGCVTNFMNNNSKDDEHENLKQSLRLNLMNFCTWFVQLMSNENRHTLYLHMCAELNRYWQFSKHI